jgi:hypothetical protein
MAAGTEEKLIFPTRSSKVPLISVNNSENRITNRQPTGFLPLKKITGSLVKLPVMKIQVRLENPWWLHEYSLEKMVGPPGLEPGTNRL